MRQDEIQRLYKNHAFLAHRDMGGVRQLTGTVEVIVFFVSERGSRWTEAAKQRYRREHLAAMKFILASARAHGVSLKLRNAYVDVALDMDCAPENYALWSKAIMAKYNAPDIPTYQRRHEDAKQCTEAPIFFVFNKPFRSRAVMSDWPARMNGEMSILSSQYTLHTIVHELLHQFGAMDLYYPNAVQTLVKRLRYQSVMATTDSTFIDSLTAYLIGWTDHISDAAAAILNATRHFTRETLVAAIREETAGR